MTPLSVLLAAALAACARAGEAPPATTPPASPAPPVPEPAKMELHIEENSVATVGSWRVALAKTWEEPKDGQTVRVAWLSVVERGAGTGQQDLELSVGQTLNLGTRTFEITGVDLAGAGTGSVHLRER